MLRTRVLTALALLGILLGALYIAPPRSGLALFSLLLLVGAYEWAPFFGWTSTAARLAYCLLIASVCAVCWFRADLAPWRAVLTVGVAWWIVATLWVTLSPSRVPRLATAAAGLLVLVPTWVALTHLLTNAGSNYVLFLLLLVWAADVGAYFAGRRYGRHALAPIVSPKKTWEGALGGVVAALLVAGLGVARFQLPGLAFLLLALLTVALSIVGDLTESLFKRNSGVKDSGAILPGHGGVLDRIDSVTAAAPVFALGLGMLGVVS